MRRLAAGISLVALLACSSIGTCWSRIATSTGHDCCAQDAALQAQAQPCGGAAASASTVDLATLVPAPVSLAHVHPPRAERPSASAFAPSHRLVAPPLVLRI